MPLTQVPTGMMDDLAVSTAKIADAAVTPAKMSQPLTLGTAQNSTSGTSINFTGIPSWVKRITVMLQGVSFNNPAQLVVSLGTGSTPTYATSGYLGSFSTTTGSAIVNNGFSSGFDVQPSVGSSAAALYHGSIILTNLTGNVWTCQGVVSRSDAAWNTVVAGSISLPALLTAVRVTSSLRIDSFDAGTINILYE